MMEDKLSPGTSVDIRTSAKKTQPFDGVDVQKIQRDVAVVEVQKVRSRVALHRALVRYNVTQRHLDSYLIRDPERRDSI